MHRVWVTAAQNVAEGAWNTLAGTVTLNPKRAAGGLLQTVGGAGEIASSPLGLVPAIIGEATRREPRRTIEVWWGSIYLGVKRYYKCAGNEKWTNAFTTGSMVWISGSAAAVWQHEAGHHLQTTLLGPAYIFVAAVDIALGSAIGLFTDVGATPILDLTQIGGNGAVTFR